MDPNDKIRDSIKQTWRDYILEPKGLREDFGFAPKNLYDMLFCPKYGLSAYSYDTYCLTMPDNAEYLRTIFNEVKKRLSPDIIELINRGMKGRDIAISVVPANWARFLNKNNEQNYLRIDYHHLNDCIYSDEISKLLEYTELEYFPVILSYYGIGKITNMIPCVTLENEP